MASSTIQWDLLKNNNRYLVKRNGFTFSSDPLNLTGKNSFKFSGLANSKAVGVNVVNGKVTLQTKRTRASRRPSQCITSTQLNRARRSGKNRAAQVIKSKLANVGYRADLTNYAIARYHALRRATKVREIGYIV